VFGSNSLFLYLLSIAGAKALRLVTVRTDNGAIISMKEYIFRILESGIGSYGGSLAFPVVLILILYLIAWILYRKNIILKI